MGPKFDGGPGGHPDFDIALFDERPEPHPKFDVLTPPDSDLNTQNYSLKAVELELYYGVSFTFSAAVPAYGQTRACV